MNLNIKKSRACKHNTVNRNSFTIVQIVYVFLKPIKVCP